MNNHHQNPHDVTSLNKGKTALEKLETRRQSDPFEEDEKPVYLSPRKFFKSFSGEDNELSSPARSLWTILGTKKGPVENA